MATGATLVALSPQLSKYSKQIVKKNSLTFPVLADIDNKVASLYGLTFTLPRELQEVYSSFGIDLPRFNGNETWQLPLSGRFIVDAQSVIRNIEVHPDYTQRPDPSEIVEILQSLK